MNTPTVHFGVPTKPIELSCYENTQEGNDDGYSVNIVFHDPEDSANDHCIVHFFFDGLSDEGNPALKGWYFQYWMLDEEGFPEEQVDGFFGPFDSVERCIERLSDPDREYKHIFLHEEAKQPF